MEDRGRAMEGARDWDGLWQLRMGTGLPFWVDRVDLLGIKAAAILDLDSNQAPSSHKFTCSPAARLHCTLGINTVSQGTAVVEMHKAESLAILGAPLHLLSLNLSYVCQVSTTPIVGPRNMIDSINMFANRIKSRPRNARVSAFGSFSSAVDIDLHILSTLHTH